MSLHFVQSSSENCRVRTAAMLVIAGTPTTFLSVQSPYKFQPSTPTYLYVFLSNRIRTEFAVPLYYFTFDNEISVKTFYEVFFLPQFRTKISGLIVLQSVSAMFFISILRNWIVCSCLPFSVSKVYENLPTRSKAESANCARLPATNLLVFL
jgi:hypothetical protein